MGPRGIDREARLVRGDGRAEDDVQHGLLQHQVGAGGDGRGADVGERPVVGREGGVGGQRDARRDDGGRGEPRGLLEERDVVGDPDLRLVGQECPGFVDLDVARAPHGEFDVPHGGEGDSKDEPEEAVLGLDEGAHDDIGGDVVGGSGGRRRPGDSIRLRDGQQRQGQADQRGAAPGPSADRSAPGLFHRGIRFQVRLPIAAGTYSADCQARAWPRSPLTVLLRRRPAQTAGRSNLYGTIQTTTPDNT